MDKNWFVVPEAKCKPALRLFCFPYAGGSAKTFVRWHTLLPDGVELVAVQPPGRGSRVFEPAFRTISDLVAALSLHMASRLDVPYVLLGHSLGGRLAFEVLLALQARGAALPVHFIASGCGAPHIPRRKRHVERMSDVELIAALAEMKGTPKPVLQNEELMRLFLPLLRADFGLVDSCLARPAEPVDCAVSLLGAVDDEMVPPEHLTAWDRHFSSRLALHWFDGGHFFIDEQGTAVADAVADILTKFCTGEVVQ